MKSNEKKPRPYLRVEDLAEWWNVSPWSIRAWVSQRLLDKAPGFGRLVRFDPEKIEKWLAAGGLEAARERKACKKISGEKEVNMNAKSKASKREK